MATSGKNPISALQELMAAKKLSLPTYFEEDAIGKFKCTVFAGGVTAVGFGSNKRNAKQESAKNALEKLKPVSQIMVLQETQKPLKNYVGELNEYASKKGITYPEYYPQTTPGIDANVCTCTFWGRKVPGRGQSKKDAKQDAARNMLKLVYTAEAQTVSMNSAKVAQTTVEELRSVFDHLTLNSVAMQSPKTNVKSAVTEIKIVEEGSVEMLEAKLRARGVDFTITDLNSDPYILSLKIKDSEFTVIENGDTREETLHKLLRKVLLMKNSGCLNSDLITF